MATDCNARFVALDPYTGAQLALAEAYRNVATTGAVPLAVTDCLNFGSPEDPHVMWQFQQAVRGLADGCALLGIPVTGGNVSFYNQTGDRAILPTPVVGVLGVIDDVAGRVPSGFTPRRRRRGAAGRHPRRARRQRMGARGARPPRRPPARGRPGRGVPPGGPARLGSPRAGCSPARTTCPTAGSRRPSSRPAWWAAAARASRCPLADPFVSLFSESAGRVLVTVAPEDLEELLGAAGTANVPAQVLGTSGGSALAVGALEPLPLAELRTAWEGTLPALFDVPAAGA